MGDTLRKEDETEKGPSVAEAACDADPVTLAPLALPVTDPTAAREWVETRTRDGLATVREIVDRLRTAPPETALVVLRAWDEASRQLSNVDAAASLLANVHPDEEVRTGSEQ